MIRRVLFILFILILTSNLMSIELGVIGGNMTNDAEYSYGLSGGLGLLIPMLKMEFEICQLTESDLKVVTAAAKLRPKLKKFGPYAVVGVGTEFEKLSFDFDGYDFFTFIGGGLHLYFKGFISLRLDVRFNNFSYKNRIRFGLGLFFHI